MSMWGAGGAGTSTQYFGLTNVLMFSGGSGALYHVLSMALSGSYFSFCICPRVIFTYAYLITTLDLTLFSSTTPFM